MRASIISFGLEERQLLGLIYVDEFVNDLIVTFVLDTNCIESLEFLLRLKSRTSVPAIQGVDKNFSIK